MSETLNKLKADRPPVNNWSGAWEAYADALEAELAAEREALSKERFAHLATEKSLEEADLALIDSYTTLETTEFGDRNLDEWTATIQAYMAARKRQSARKTTQELS